MMLGLLLKKIHSPNAEFQKAEKILKFVKLQTL